MGIEEQGIPCVSIVQEDFIADAQASSEAFNLPNPSLALAITPQVFTALTTSQTRKAIDPIIGDIIKGLTEPLPEYKEDVVGRMVTRGPKDEVIEFTGRDYQECYGRMNDSFLEWGWSDGFPLIPPTEQTVQEMLRGTSRPADDRVVEKFVPGMAQARVKDIAVNAVMAGCKPEFLPVVIGAVEAMHDPSINLRLAAMSTAPHAPLFIINGPITQKLHINSGLCALGPAGPGKLSYANVVIGRAVRLILMNVGNCYPGVMDQDTIGAPTKFGMVLAENERANPWDPYHVEKGFKPEESTVTCCYGHSLVSMCDLESNTAAGLMNTFARHLKGIAGISITDFEGMILLAPDHAAILAREGWTKEDIREYLHLHCRISAEEYRRSACAAYGVPRRWLDAADSKAMVPLYRNPEDFQIVVVGGMAGQSSAYAGRYPANPRIINP